MRGIYPIINDYSSIYNKCAEFLYHPIDCMEGFAMRTYDFVEIINSPAARNMKNEIDLNYKYAI